MRNWIWWPQVSASSSRRIKANTTNLALFQFRAARPPCSLCLCQGCRHSRHSRVRSRVVQVILGVFWCVPTALLPTPQGQTGGPHAGPRCSCSRRRCCARFTLRGVWHWWPLHGSGSKHFGAVILEPHLGQPCSTCCPDELTEAEWEAEWEPAALPSPQRMGVFKQHTLNNCAKAEAATLHTVWGCVVVGCPLGISLCSTGQSDQGECSEVQTVLVTLWNLPHFCSSCTFLCPFLNTVTVLVTHCFFLLPLVDTDRFQCCYCLQCGQPLFVSASLWLFSVTTSAASCATGDCLIERAKKLTWLPFAGLCSKVTKSFAINHFDSTEGKKP